MAESADGGSQPYQLPVQSTRRLPSSPSSAANATAGSPSVAAPHQQLQTPATPNNAAIGTEAALWLDTSNSQTATAGTVTQTAGEVLLTSPQITAELPLGDSFDTVELPPPVADSLPAEVEVLATPALGENPPLEDEVARWYEYPWRWMTQGWKNHAEFGLDGSDGNSDTLAVQTGLELKRKTGTHTLGIDLEYRQASNRNMTTEDNGRFNLDLDRKVGESSWSMFGKLGLEWDQFKAFNIRVNMNSGVGYHWIRNDQTSLISRFGAGASREFGAPIDEWKPEAVFGLEAEHQLTKRQKLKGKVEYFPAWERFSDYRLVSDFAWEMLLDGSENLSLKLAATDRYDSTPQGARPNDLYYSMLLLYKF